MPIRLDLLRRKQKWPTYPPICQDQNDSYPYLRIVIITDAHTTT